MGPEVGRAAFNIALILVVFSALSLFYQLSKGNELALHVSFLALLVSSLFLTVVVFEVRRQVAGK